MLKVLDEAGVTSGKIGIINVNAATDSCVNREEGFRAAFEGTDFELMETQYGEGDAAKSQSIAENYITQGVSVSSAVTKVPRPVQEMPTRLPETIRL